MKGRRRCSGLTLVKVREGLGLGGCPVCRMLRRTEEKIIENILYEGVNDPEIRGEIRKTLGLCPYHAWMFVQVASKPGVLDGLGATIIYEDMLSTYLEDMEKKSQGTCLLCRFASEFENIFTSDYAACFDADEKILSEYAASDTILCDRHFKAILAKMRNPEAREKLRSIQKEKIEEILRRMREFIRKNDYRVKEEILPEEATAWMRAVEILKGYDTSTTILQPGMHGTLGKENSKLLGRLLGKH